MIKLENFSNYEIFPEEGKVFNIKTKKWIGYPNKSRGGYWYVGLYDDNGKQKTFRLARLIYEAVHGKIPEDMQVNHISEDKADNSIFNLNLMTPKENCNWGTRNQRRIEKLTNGKLSKPVAAYKDGILVMTFSSTREAGRNGFCNSNVSDCCRNCYLREGNNTYKEYQWIYFDDCPPLFIDVA